MAEIILTLNAGSSSLKFGVFSAEPEPRVRHRGCVDAIGTPRASLQVDGEPENDGGAIADHGAALQRLLDWLEEQGGTQRLLAVGHRVVHGGERYAEPVRLTATVRADLDRYVTLAPLHQPHNLAAVDALSALRPDLPQVLCFDTAFHRSQPPLAQRFALPRALSAQGLCRYGFHGLSYEYIAQVLPTYADGLPTRTIVAHLGNGASLCALAQGRSVATTMGLTPLDGVPMGTRPGSLDPGVVLYMIKTLGMAVDEVEDLLYHRCGLLGVSGISHDMRTLLASAEPDAHEAIDLFVYRVGREIGSLAAALGGLDALVFTAGIGEHAAVVRERICRQAGWLGVELDPEANADHRTRISTSDSRVAVWVIPTDEERMIARHTRSLLTQT
jgi:acetate kinase